MYLDKVYKEGNVYEQCYILDLPENKVALVFPEIAQHHRGTERFPVPTGPGEFLLGTDLSKLPAFSVRSPFQS